MMWLHVSINLYSFQDVYTVSIFFLPKNKLYSKIISIKIGTRKILWFSWPVEHFQKEVVESNWRHARSV